MSSINLRIFALKFCFLLFLPALILGETYYEVRSSNGDAALQPSSALEPSQQQQQQQQPAPPSANGQSELPHVGFPSFTFPQPSSFFSLSTLSAISPLFYGVGIGAILVYVFQYFFSGGASKLLSSKFYNTDEETEAPVVNENDDSMDLKKEASPAGNATKVAEGKTRRRRNARRLARAAGRIHSAIENFEQRFV